MKEKIKFEEKAEKWADKMYPCDGQAQRYLFMGAKFGYNEKCKELEEANKADEWHYMKDVNCYEDLPQNKDVYYAYVVNVGAYDEPTIERKLGCFAEFEFDVMAYHVIAWKEIVLPELKESR